MDIWSEIITEVNKYTRLLDSGDMKLEEYAFRLQGLKLKYGSAASSLKTLVHSATIKSKNNSFNKLLSQKGLVGDGCLVSPTPEEAALETVKCEQHNAYITREECKNKSGSGQCDMSECDINQSTRALVTNRLKGR